MTNRTLVRVRAGVRAWIKIYIRVLRTWSYYRFLNVKSQVFLESELLLTHNESCPSPGPILDFNTLFTSLHSGPSQTNRTKPNDTGTSRRNFGNFEPVSVLVLYRDPVPENMESGNTNLQVSNNNLQIIFYSMDMYDI